MRSAYLPLWESTMSFKSSMCYFLGGVCLQCAMLMSVCFFCKQVFFIIFEECAILTGVCDSVLLGECIMYIVEECVVVWVECILCI